MAENNKIYITANELAEMLGVSVGHAYKLNSHARLACYTMNKTGVASGSFS